MTLLFTLAEIKQAAEKVFESAKEKKVWAIHGEMGAGKTTFIHAICENLEVVSAIGSPTYSIINEYKSEKAGQIYHMDWYRLKDEEEALQAGVEDPLFSGSLCMVEWPERAPGLLPDDCLHVTISIVDAETRQLSFE
ncbi:tRNA (adenosine(37)-N6)-threonylcarbamoyltransferase complex ATPase subunit type 1 TsaE [Segetibacter aerophilus]|uniref:tRNA threonylcarbamoyladenosine biosynthesis protein TsaE n=1 Tax=Segetibacter aerophilus TaxID=670293 RepID=A0A512BIE1_9BACT|nr:tRNA (adenosine(37)-N6)-threonylcarbamoyltransferase complex ATPase subunit type 1 TsaE [Segetibacter aerophilus]GEO11723.1 tRNA (adenosine(37)-N6)-threonylcarbamoyltransferase complex ATPase subunit type 1 TsaE [Segetibacter aerophilus]